MRRGIRFQAPFAAALVGLAVVAVLPGRARAEVAVFGHGTAQECYQAALAGRSDPAALHLCDLALQLDDLIPEDRGGTFINRGVMKLRQRRLDAALADLDAGVKLNPAAGDGWLDHGAVLTALGRYGEGLAELNKSLALGVSQPEKAYFNRAIAEEGQGDETSAYFDYQKALALRPGWDLPKKELTRFTVTRK